MLLLKKVIGENAFEQKKKQKKKENGVKFNPGLSANRPSNNSAQDGRRKGTANFVWQAWQ